MFRSNTYDESKLCPITSP